MRKVIFFGLLTFLVLNFCIFAVAQQEIIEIRLGCTNPPGSPPIIGAERAADIVFKETEGRIKINIFPSSQLGGSKDMVQSQILGTLDMLIESPGLWSPIIPRLSILEAPYIPRDLEHLRKMVYSPIGQTMIRELLTKYGVRTIGIEYYGTRQMTSNRPINSPSDVKGFKIRVPQQDISVEWAKAIGASPTPMAFSEVYMALQTGLIDGQENPLTTIYANKLHEVQKYIIMDNHVIQVLFITINEAVWQSLSPQDQKILISAFEEGARLTDETVIEREASLLGKMEAEGIKVIRPNVEPFAELMQPLYDKFEDIWGKGVYEAMKNIK